MTPKSFTEVVQAFLAVTLVMVFSYQAIMAPDYKDALIQALMVGLGFWLGSSRSSQQKDENAQP